MKTEIFSVWTAGREKNQVVPEHSHDYYEMVFYQAGEGRTRIGQEEYLFEADTLAVIPPHVQHMEQHRADGHVICICFYTKPQWNADFFPKPDGKIRRLILEILEEAQSQSWGYMDMIAAMLNRSLILLKREKQENTAGRKNDFTFIIRYLSDNYREKISMKALSAQMNLSYDYFRHRFREEIGCSPQQFLMNTRMEAAERMLEEGEWSCTEIAYQCGFSNSAQFSALFRRKHGATPSDYRKERMGSGF